MRLPDPRGPLSTALFADLLGGTLSPATIAQADRTAASGAGAFSDDDLQISLAVCYELHYRGFDGVSEDWEWDPALIGLRAGLERRHLAALRELVGPLPTSGDPVDRQLTALIAADDGPSLSSYMAKQGTLEQWREYLTLRSVYHLKEGDPHTFAVPRLSGRTKSAMVEIQADEYGGGSPQRMHSELFAGLMRDLELDAGYGGLWNEAPAVAFASVNTMSLLGCTAAGGVPRSATWPAVEMTSSEPSRRYRPACAGSASASGRRCSTTSTWRPTPCTNRSPRSTCAAHWWPTSPSCCADVLFGAACSLAMDGVAAGHLLGASEDGRAARCTATDPGRLSSVLVVGPRRAEDLRRRARAAGGARRGEARPLVRAVAERLDPRLPAAAQRDRLRPGSISAPSWSSSRKSPRTISGPSR